MRGIYAALPAGAIGLALSLPAQYGNAATEKVEYSFCSQSGCPDGAWPYAGMSLVNGTLYGTTFHGGSNQEGAVFALDLKTGTETVLHSFGDDEADGTFPTDRPKIVNGILYGTTSAGGSGGRGTVFAVNLQTGAETTFGLGGTGAEPIGGLIEIHKLYGTTVKGGNRCGSAGCGTVFSFDPETGTEKTLYVFDGTHGQNPADRLLRVGRVVYGTTNQGGYYDNGTVFAFDPKSGTETVVYAFGPVPDGENPVGHLIDVNGVLYGTAQTGGRNGGGAVFAVDINSRTEKIVHSFGNHSDGRDPHAGLIDVSGTLYGTTTTGGTYGGGTVFSFDPGTGAETVVYSFGSGTDGSSPCGDLNANSGTLYGTTLSGGTYGSGTVFSIALSSHSAPAPEGSHGFRMSAGLARAGHRPAATCEIAQ